MRRPVKSYAERSAEMVTPRQEPWERPMARMIADNFEAIALDIPRIGTVAVIKLLEAERQEEFDAFLADRERRAKARLDKNPLDVEATRQLEAVEKARHEPPFEPFKISSFSQALHLERKKRRAAGTLSASKPAALTRTKTLSPIEVLRKAATGETSSRSVTPAQEEPAAPDDHRPSSAADQPAAVPALQQSGTQAASTESEPASVTADSSTSGASAPEERSAVSRAPQTPSASEQLAEASQPIRRRGPAMAKFDRDTQ